MLLLLPVLPLTALGGVLDIQYSNKFSLTRATLNIDDSVVFTVSSNTTLYETSTDCKVIQSISLNAGGTFLKTFKNPGSFQIATEGCKDAVSVQVNEFPVNPYLQKESMLLAQYEKQIIQAKAASSALRSTTAAVGFMLMLMV
jgi:hypothetical protein